MSTRSGSSITKRVRRILLGDTLPTVDALDDAVVLHVLVERACLANMRAQMQLSGSAHTWTS